MGIESSKNSAITPRDYALAALLAIFCLILCRLYVVPEVCGVFHDDAIYVGTAKAIAQGDGYRLINLPGSPRQTKYPFLYPLLLSLVWKLSPRFPENVFYMQMLTSFLAALSIGLCYLFLVRFNYVSRLTAFVSCLVCVTVPGFLYFSTGTLSEIPFFLLILLSSIALDDHAERSPTTRLQEFTLGMLLAMPFLCRSVGIVFILSGVLFRFFRGGRIRWLVCGVLTAVLPWLLWVYAAAAGAKTDPLSGYYTDYLSWWVELGLPFITTVVSLNLLYALTGGMTLIIPGFVMLSREISTHLPVVFLIALGAVPWIATILHAGRSRALNWFLIGYLVLVCIWPWPPQRFLVPILPFLIAYFFVSIGVVLKKTVSSKLSRCCIISVSCVLAAANLWSVTKNIEVRKRAGFPLGIPSEAVTWRSYQELFEWIEMNTPPEATIAYGLDTMSYLYTGRSAIRPFVGRPTSLFYGDDHPATGTVRDLVSILNGYRPGYLVQTPMPNFAEEKPFNALLADLSSECPDCLAPVYVGSDPRFRVYEVHGDALETFTPKHARATLQK